MLSAARLCRAGAALRKVSARKGGNERFFAEIAGFFALSLDFAGFCARIEMNSDSKVEGISNL